MAQHVISWKRVVVACLAVVAVASTAAAANPDGTWTWTFTRGNQEVDLSLELKHDGEKLTGQLSLSNGNGVEIKDGTFKNDEVAFTIEFERNGNVRVTKYKGKVDGDTIKGTRESERNGEVQARDWEAKRAEQ